MHSLQEYKMRTDVENIENGYFILTMFPSLKCELNCPHCYLTKEQRSGETYLSKELFIEMIGKVMEYYEEKEISTPTIVFYWYGGEPTALPLDYYKELIAIAKNTFPETYNIQNHFLTNLFTLDAQWLDFLSTQCNNYFQTSYDFLMRGSKYLDRWLKNVKKTSKLGFNIAAINVFNSTMIGKEEEVYAQLKDIGVTEIGFLPFMKNYANLAKDAKEYKEWYADMASLTQFLKNFLKIHIEDLKNDPKTFRIGNVAHIFKNMDSNNFYNNIAGQTLFFLETGDFALPDYVSNYMDRKEIEFQDVEYLNKFEKIQGNDFKEVLTSKNREEYLNRQITLNGNERCIKCDYKNFCSMEFWKGDNLDNSGECPGNYGFIEHIIKELSKEDFQLLKSNYNNLQLT